jgi:hypothetical protein
MSPDAREFMLRVRSVVECNATNVELRLFDENMWDEVVTDSVDINTATNTAKIATTLPIPTSASCIGQQVPSFIY